MGRARTPSVSSHTRTTSSDSGPNPFKTVSRIGKEYNAIIRQIALMEVLAREGTAGTSGIGIGLA
jgi:hypothetical protein